MRRRFMRLTSTVMSAGKQKKRNRGLIPGFRPNRGQIHTAGLSEERHEKRGAGNDVPVPLFERNDLAESAKSAPVAMAATAAQKQ